MEKGILKKASAVALASVMAVSLVPVMGTMTNGTVGQIVADAAQADRSGTCGESMTWELDGTGTLTISGSGRMYDFADEEAPWYEIRSEIKSLQIGNNVTRLGMYAFWDCSNLSEVKLPDSLKEIGRGAFEDCDSLKGITFPANLASIFADAFYDCDGLEKIHIPASVTLVDDSAFDECSSVRKITVASGNKVYDSRDNCNAIIETAENTIESVWICAFNSIHGIDDCDSYILACLAYIFPVATFRDDEAMVLGKGCVFFISSGFLKG